MGYPDIQVNLVDHMVTITLDRPVQMNTLTPEISDRILAALEQSMEQATMFLFALRQSDDHREGVAAFLEKRETNFRGT
jgi:enoyl-CoA hydratase/carnithine racemase